MNLVFITEGRFARCPDGNVYSLNGEFTNSLWERYLSVFDEMTIIARVTHNDLTTVNKQYLAINERVSFIDLPYYVGLWDYLKVSVKIRMLLRKHIKPGVAYICRVPGNIGKEASAICRSRNIPYAVEVVGDPYDVFAKDTFSHPFRILLRYLSTTNLMKVTRESKAALYVTENILQQRYPVRKGMFSINASNVQIKDNTIAKIPKQISKKLEYNIISIGTLEQTYKAPDVVLRAISILKAQGIICSLVWLGEGIYKAELIELASSLGILDKVDFKGNVPSNEVRTNLQASDIFVLVSRTEGLPRAVIEAMACGLPCIGTNVGGIPELLDSSVLIEKNNVMQLVEAIKTMIFDCEFANAQAKRNLIESGKYAESILRERRNLFFREVVKTVGD